MSQVETPAGAGGWRGRFRVSDHWGTAASILAHGAVLGALMWSNDIPPPSMASPSVEMTMPALENAEMKNTPDAVTTAVKPPDVIQEKPTETVQLAEARPDIAPDVKPDPLQPTTLPETEPEIEVIETRAVEPPVVIPPAPRPRPVRQVAAPAPAPVAPPVVNPAPPAPEALPVPPSPAPIATHVAEAASGAMAGPPPDYLTALRAWLEKHKQYPQQAQRRRQQGTTLLRFTLAWDGRLLAHSIERSSGFESLDVAVGEMIERAAPLPPLPPDMGQDKLEIVVPIAFYLR